MPSRLNGGCQELTVLQSAFAAELLFIATLCFAKLSIILFLNLITRQRLHRLLGYSLGAFITVGSATELIAVAFTCETPATWDIFGSKCYNKVGYHRASFGIDLLTSVGSFLVRLWYI